MRFPGETCGELNQSLQKGVNGEGGGRGGRRGAAVTGETWEESEGPRQTRDKSKDAKGRERREGVGSGNDRSL